MLYSKACPYNGLKKYTLNVGQSDTISLNKLTPGTISLNKLTSDNPTLNSF